MSRAVHVVVLGGGSWGTTVASLAAANTPSMIWARDAEIAAEVNAEHTNQRYLGERALHPRLTATYDLSAAVSTADVLVVGVPSHSIRSVLTEAAPHLRPWVPVLSLAKGLEPETRMRPTEVIGDVLAGHPIGLLAGPNLAREILDGYAAAAVIATQDERVGLALQPLFHSPVFRVYRNDDLVGSEMGGVLKNIIAIAMGMADGLGVGDNTRAMVLTRGLAEITRLGEAMGGDQRTFAGLTGLGDLTATCSSRLSRNRRIGEELARGKTLEQAIAELGQVAEGVKTAGTVMELADEHGVEMAIAAEVDGVVNRGRSPREAFRGLLRMAPSHELHGAGW
jgi:glycerol-3-phosphate dehydrogenase (NAD(P)+)